MIHPIPSGTRDILPAEMRELHAIEDALRATFETAGYGEISTPALEYESTLARGGEGASQPAYRLFDEHGAVLVLRSDMTVPIARVAATRFAATQPPLRFSYLAQLYRGVRPQRAQPREVLQAGIELLGSPAPGGTAEALQVLCDALDAAGLRDYRIGLGDARLYPSLLDGLGVAHEPREAILHELVTRDFAGLEREVRALGLGSRQAALLLEVPSLRGGEDVLERADGGGSWDGAATEALSRALGGLRSVHQQLAPPVARRVIFDLGLTRDLGYYTGAVFDVYDPALGTPLGGGGRYDELLERFGRPLPAVGFALDVKRLHAAMTVQGRAR